MRMRNAAKTAAAIASFCIAAVMSASCVSAAYTFDSTDGGKYTWTSGTTVSGNGTTQTVSDGMVTYSIGGGSTNDCIYDTSSKKSLVWWNGGNSNFLTSDNGRTLTFTPTYDGTVSITFKSIGSNQTAALYLYDGSTDESLASSVNSASVNTSFEAKAGTTYTLHPTDYGVAITALTFTAPSKAVTYTDSPEKVTHDGVTDAVAFYGEASSAGSDAAVGFTLTAGEKTANYTFDTGTTTVTTNGAVVFGLVVDELSNAGLSIDDISASYYTGE